MHSPEYSVGTNGNIVHNLSDSILTIYNTEKMENKLNGITVQINPLHYKRRKFLSEQFRDQLSKTKDVNLFIVELAYDDEPFEITDKNHKNHLQLRTERYNLPWSKENVISIAIQHILPSDYKAFAWIDGDLEIDSGTRHSDTLKLLNGKYDIIQMCNVCLDMDKEKTPWHVFTV